MKYFSTFRNPALRISSLSVALAFLFVFLFKSGALVAQTVTDTTCHVLFFDTGGEFANYSDNEDKTWVFYPENPGSKLRVRINSMSTEQGYDLLYIYDGPDTLAKEFSGSPFSGSHSNLTLTASALNTSGALTFRFVSDVGYNEYGWDAEVMCSELDTAVKVYTWYTWNITATTAQLGGEIICGDSTRVLSRGVCWSTDPDPDLNDQFTQEAAGPGDFLHDVSGLSPNTTYFVRVYAITTTDTLYGFEANFTTFWAGYHQEVYKSNLSYFHPSGGSYPDVPYMVREANKTLRFIEEGRAETWFAIWNTTLCWITINPDNSIGFEVDDTWGYEVLPGDPNDPSKISYYDPETGKIYLYYYYVGGTGNRIFWEVFTPPPPPTAPTILFSKDLYIPFSVKAGTIVGSIGVQDINVTDTHTLELESGYGDNSLFGIQSKKLVLKSDLNLTSPQDLSVKIKATDNTGLSAEFESVIHANTDKYTIQNLDQSLTNYYTDEIIAINENNIWMHGRNGEVARTIDGGQTWDTVSLRLSPESYFGPMFAIDSLTAWLVVSQGDLGIYKTVDGGLSWNKQNAGFTESSFPDLVYFWNKDEGFVLGDKDYSNLNYLEIYTTTDGGDSWTRVAQDNLPAQVNATVNTKKVMSVYKDTVWISATEGYMLRSTDKGKTWTALDAPVTNQLGGIVFLNGKEGLFSPFTSGVKSLFITHNGGETWNTLTTNVTVNNYYQQFSLIPGTQTIVMTDNNSLYFSTDKGTSWNKSDILYPFLYGIAAVNHNLLWATGGFNHVYRMEMLPGIEGKVIDPMDSPVTDGYALLYQVAEDMRLSVVDSVRIMPDGSFNFLKTSPGKHLILAVADPGLYPDAVPTYYGDNGLWSEALEVELDYTLNIDPVEIRMIQITTMEGEATLSGVVVEGDLKAGTIIKSGSAVMGNPVKSAGIILVGRSKSGTIRARTTTDENGYFEFNNVPVGEYDILVDIPGMEIISYHTVTVTETDTEIPNLSFIVGKEGIIITSNGDLNNSGLRLYPNPNHGTFVIELSSDNFPQLTITIVDMQGRIHYEKEVTGPINELNTRLEKGIYLLRINTPEKQILHKLIIE
ncbi:MAG: YCF48-related protein [Bacteroidales bacterium]